jgi:hypothetical protein
MNHIDVTRARIRRLGLVVATAGAVLVGGAGWGAAPALAAGSPVTYRDHTYSTAVSSPTADKPQSKVWRNDGAWWAVLVSAAAAVPTVHELRSDHTWRDTGVVVDSRVTSTADTQAVGNTLYVASRASGSSMLFSRFTYSPGSRTYSLDGGFPVTIATGGSESLSFARDSTGTIWATWTRSSKVYMSHTTTSDASWTKGVTVPAPDVSISSDDISAIVAFNGKIGIMWSDQSSVAFRFAIHADGAADTAWTVETPLSGGAIADDHISLKAIPNDPQGRVFAAVKTSNGDHGEPSSSPLIIALRRSSSGTWTQATGSTVKEDETRPQIVLDSEANKLYLLMTAPVTAGTIYYKSSSMDSLSFSSGKGSTFMTWSGAKINNVSTTKDPVTSITDLVAIAADSSAHRYFHAEMAL